MPPKGQSDNQSDPDADADAELLSLAQALLDIKQRTTTPEEGMKLLNDVLTKFKTIPIPAKQMLEYPEKSIDIETFNQNANSSLLSLIQLTKQAEKFAAQASKLSITTKAIAIPMLQTIVENARTITTLVYTVHAIDNVRNGKFNAWDFFTALDFTGISMPNLYNLFTLHNAVSSFDPNKLTAENLAYLLVATLAVSLVVKFSTMDYPKNGKSFKI